MATMSVVDDSKGLVRASAGLRLGNLYAGLYDHNPSWTFPAGVCPSVGLGGHIAAGGYGTLARKFGVGADNVVAATVVLADGRIVKADANTNADLFYAIRGGGGGSYGFVVDLTLRAAQVTENYVAKVTYPNVDDAAKVVETWYNWVSGPLSKRNASIPTTGKTFDGWAVNMQMNLFKDGPLSFGVRYTPSTPSSVEEFTAILASSGMTDTSKFAWKWDSPPAKVNNLVAQSFSDGQPATLSDDEARAFLAVPQRQTDVNWKDRSRLKSEYVRGKLNPAFYATVQDVLKQASNVSPWSMIQLEAYGGMINAAAASTNGFAHRGNTQFVIQYGLYFSKTLPDPTIPAGLSWLTNTENAFKPFVSGEHYQGYVDLDVSPQSFYGQHYPKLVRIKQKYDPGNVLWSDLVPPKTSKIWFGPTYLH
ncbi:hypothetical protein HK104_010072 [Borealophlyctis nickersoniae]|nr:hypothetical protein HK104_010072 [Borealophlyctis nickersoniae]